MLPSLQQTDLLAITPDVSCIDLWSDTFSYKQIPEGFGCYAFSSKATGEVVYIGSACAHSPDPYQRGLKMRIKFYRDRGKTGAKSTRRVRQENQVNPLALSLWLCEATGDCRKYEDDAIRRHLPRLNIMGACALTLEQYHKQKQQASKRTMLKNRKRPFDPDAIRNCTRCCRDKACREFRRNRNKRLGTQARCLQCERELRELKKACPDE